LLAPYLRARVIANQVHSDDNKGDMASYGVGAGLLWDVIRIDFMKGDYWQTVISIRPDFWDLL
jgi:hypothetical protein